MLNQIVQLVGISGCGKTRICKEIGRKKLLPEVTILEFGELLKKEMFTSNTTTKEAENAILARIISAQQPTMYTSHIVFPDSEGVFRCDYETEKRTQARGFVFLMSDPKKVFERRAADMIKKRRIDTPEYIQHHQEETYKAVRNITDMTTARLLVVDNEKSLDYCVTEIAAFNREVFRL